MLMLWLYHVTYEEGSAKNANAMGIFYDVVAKLWKSETPEAELQEHVYWDNMNHINIEICPKTYVSITKWPVGGKNPQN